MKRNTPYGHAVRLASRLSIDCRYDEVTKRLVICRGLVHNKYTWSNHRHTQQGLPHNASHTVEPYNSPIIYHDTHIYSPDLNHVYTTDTTYTHTNTHTHIHMHAHTHTCIHTTTTTTQCKIQSTPICLHTLVRKWASSQLA